MPLEQWLADRFREEGLGGWGIDVTMQPGADPVRALTIQLPYPTTLAFRFLSVDPTAVPPTPTPVPTARLEIHRGNSNGEEVRRLAPGTYYAGCGDLKADLLAPEPREGCPERLIVWCWIPRVPDNIPMGDM